MADTPAPLATKTAALHDALRAHRVPHAFGGALALAYYTEPRSTIDIDVNVFVAPGNAAPVMAALGDLGVEIPDTTLPIIERDGQVRLWWGDTAIDLFFAYDPFHDAAAARTRDVPFADSTIPILAATDLIVCKTVFDRPKDRIDIEQMLFAVPNEIDVAEARRWIVHILGDGDPGIARYEQTVARILGPEALDDPG